MRDITMVVGLPLKENGRVFNAAMVLRDGEVKAVHRKNRLDKITDGDCFHPGTQLTLFNHEGARFGLMIGSDLSEQKLMCHTLNSAPHALLVLNASPFYAGVEEDRLRLAREAKIPLLWVNACGGQDDLVFDGSSFAVAEDGRMFFRAPFCREFLQPCVWESVILHDQPKNLCERQYRAMVMSLRDYAFYCGFSDVCLGLSGGLDSALTLALAVEALEAGHCEVLLLPGPYTAELSNGAAARMARSLGVSYRTVAVSPLFEAFKSALAPRFEGLPEDLTEENLQARIRGTLLMALSNKTGALLLATGNKSEIAVGYATLYGDMNGGFTPIKDLYKTEVYAVARWLNAEHDREIIPREIIERPPSAELRPDQTDQDSLPDYAVLDAMLRRISEKNASLSELIAAGFNPEEAARTVRLLRAAEYKRRQGAIGPRLSRTAFGRDIFQPLCHNFQDSRLRR